MLKPEKHSRQWDLRKKKLIAVLEDFSKRSPVMGLMGVEDVGNELRAVVSFETETLVRPFDGDVMFAGPVITGIRYHRRFLSESPVPWELVTILAPVIIYHPSVNINGGMCLGHPLPGISMEEILHTTWAGLVLNTRVVNTVDWNVFNPSAAAYIRAHKDKFPITQQGLLESIENGKEQKQ